MRKGYWEAVATLVGTIIGAGILGIPYVISQVGVWPGFLLLIGLGLATLLMNLMFAEIVLRTKMKHQIAGYAKKYLGLWPYRLEVISLLIGGYGALVTYLIGEGQVLATLLGGGPSFWYSLGFWALGAVVLYFGLNLIKILELWLVIVFMIIVVVIVGVSGLSMDISNLHFVAWENIFLPYGVILFAYGGMAAIVSMREILSGREKRLRSAVVIGTLIPLVVYVVFALVVVGVTGLATTQIATVGLGQKVGPYMLLFGNLFAFLAMGTCFMSIGLVLKGFFHYDLKWSKFKSWLAVVIGPGLLFLLGSRNFIETMGTVGSLTFGVSGIIVILIFWRAKKVGDRLPEFKLPRLRLVGWVLAGILALGMLHTFYAWFV